MTQQSNHGKPQASAGSGSSPPDRCRQWRLLWRQFASAHSSWVSRILADEAAYFLPEPIITELASPRGNPRRLKAFLGERDAKAERDFGKMCGQFGPHTIGVCQGNPLQFPLLSESWPIEPHGSLPEHEEEGIGRTHRQQLAYAGYLSFHEPYREELEQLRQTWQSLAQPKPIVGPWLPERLARKAGVPEASLAYYRAYETFRGRWHLAMLVNWEIPWPMGPCDYIKAEDAMKMLGSSFVLDYHPPYVDTPRRSISDKALLAASMAKYPKCSPGMPEPPPMSRVTGQGSGPSELATAFRMWLIEMAVRRRYGNPRGLTGCLIRGFSRWLGPSAEHVRRLRRIYAGFIMRSNSH
jgi:hypothetical protein